MINRNSIPEPITSRQNTLVKLLASLSEKKVREEKHLFRFDGWKLAAEAIGNGIPLEVICLRQTGAERMAEKLGIDFGSGNDRVRVLEDGVFEKISEEKSPEGVICVAKTLDKFHKMVTINNNGDENPFSRLPRRILYLSSVRDPGNVGTVLRTAAAFGAEEVILSGDSADLYAPRTLRAAMGAVFRIPTTRVKGNDCDAIGLLRKQGRRVYATALDASAKELGTFTPALSDCFVIGNEGHGLSESVISAASGTVYIPMTEGSESLNAAMAASVCLWEIHRAAGLR